MKHILYILGICLLAVISCNEQLSYQINGEIENFEGYVFLRYGDHADSTLVENGKFQFTGSVDRTVQATITNKADGFYTAPFYLDNETVHIKTDFNDPHIGLISVESPSNALVQSVMADLGAIMEDEERLRSNELFLYMDSVTTKHPRNDFIIELSSEIITSEYITFEQSNSLLSNIDTLLMDSADLKATRISMSRQQRIKLGDPFPDFNFEGLDGTAYTKESFPNQYLLIDIWATWCGPCLIGFEELLPIYKELNGQLEVLAISIDPSKDRPENFLNQNKLPWKQAYVEGEWDNPFMQQLGVVYLPFYYLLSPEGEIIAINPKMKAIPELIKNHSSLR
jgi:thiol-disulfide isomerase/thioredoxin